MAKPTQDEITKEISTLREQVKTVRKFSTFGDDNRKAIEAQIETLHEVYDEDDIDENIDSAQRENAMDALYWANGDEEMSPSESWAPLCGSV